VRAVNLILFRFHCHSRLAYVSPYEHWLSDTTILTHRLQNTSYFHDYSSTRLVKWSNQFKYQQVADNRFKFWIGN
jgi:hypothetical protein